MQKKPCVKHKEPIGEGNFIRIEKIFFTDEPLAVIVMSPPFSPLDPWTHGPGYGRNKPYTEH